MGLKTDSAKSNNIYLSILNGKLCQKVTAGTEGAKERVNKNGDTVHELHFTGIEGRIVNVAITEADKSTYGSELHITMTSEGQKFVIQTPATGGYAFGFLCRLPNIDFEKDCELRTFSIPKEKDPTKNNNFIVVYQRETEGGEFVKLASAFTKEEPNGLPELVTLKDAAGKELLKAGKPIWDDSARHEFWNDLVYGDNGVNARLIELYGTAEQKAGTEDKDDFTSNTDVPEGYEAQMSKDADEQKLSAQNAADAAKADVSNAPKKAAAKKAAAKK